VATSGDDGPLSGSSREAAQPGNFRVQTPDGDVVFEVSKDFVQVKLGDWNWTHRRPDKHDTEVVALADEPQAAEPQPAATAQADAAADDAGASADAPQPESTDTSAVEDDVSLLRPKWMDGVTDPAAEVVIEGSPKVTPEEAIASALAKAAGFLKQEHAKVYGEHGQWNLPLTVVRDHAQVDLFVEPYKVVTAGEPQGITTNRAFVLISLSPEVRQQVYLTWREQIVERRLWAFGGGGVFALATLIVGAGAGYLRLDTLSHGAYRRRLKLAAVSLIVAGGLAVAAVLA
jgi:hypothetical protein